MKRIALLLLLVACPARAGPTYQWTGTGTQAMGIVEPHTSPQVIDYLPVPYDASVTLTYSPDPTASLLSTQGDTSSFRAQFSLAITGGGSGFVSGSLTGTEPGIASIFVTAPATGLDKLDFYALGDSGIGGHGPGGFIEVWAPAGTLATSTELPPNLDTFVLYAQTNPAGYFSYEHPVVSGSSGATNWAGTASGTLGDPPSSTPEPSAIVSMSIGITLLLSALLFQRWRHKS